MVLYTIIAPSQCLLEFANIYHLNIYDRDTSEPTFMCGFSSGETYSSVR